MGIITKLRMALDFGKRNSQVGQGEWQAMTHNGGKSMGTSSIPTARGRAKLETYFAKNRELRFWKFYRRNMILGDISDVKIHSTSKRDRWVGGWGG